MCTRIRNNQLAQMASLEQFRVNRRALRIVLNLSEEHDFLYEAPLPGAQFDPTDYGRAEEYTWLRCALCLDPNSWWYYRTPLPPPIPTTTPWEWTWPGSELTDEELFALLE